MPRISNPHRNTIIAASVVAFHVGALWALQSGLLRRAVEVFVPVDVISEFIEPTAPKAAQPAPPIHPPEPLTPPPQQPIVNAPEPAPNAPVIVAAPVVTPVAPSPPAPAQSANVEMPSSDAQYLQNPKPGYPIISKRMGEQGKVIVHVLIGVDGKAQRAEISQSSNYDRLDQAALNTVLSWRYVPGKRAGVPEAMWFYVPINFVLE